MFALYAGLVLVAITGMTVYSVVGRDFFGQALIGDFELVQVGMACAVAAFMPICQFNRGNILVDFFTARAGEATRARLDRLGALLLALMLLLIAWRTALGAIEAWETNTVSMMMEFPEWVAYGAIVPPLVLTALIAIAQALGARIPAA
ncbi:MAG: TRAP transporter small permease subunit [Burkholderiales bacterium]|nr:MAG: TRAP transporter small permease subunit [Burkholderiales bacterium]